MNKKTVIILVSVLVALALLAVCLTAAAGAAGLAFFTISRADRDLQAATYTPVQPTPTAPPAATFTAVQPTPTGPPAVTVTPVQPTPQAALTATPLQTGSERYSFGGVSLAKNPNLFSGLSGQVVPADPMEDGDPYWGAAPEHILFEFSDYAHRPSFHKPVLRVYPVEEYRQLSPAAAKILDSLQATLTQRPANPDSLPFLPVWNAGQVFHTQLKYLDFQNGSGVRYLTEYAQYVAPINNFDLFYTFQGLTQDGRHVVSLILPVGHGSLPANFDALSTQQMEAIADDPGYYPGMAASLAAQPDDSFTPSLAELDALVSSLMVER